MPLFLLNFIGYIVANWKFLLALAGVFVALVLFGLLMRSCESKPKLNEAQIQKAQQAIAEKDRQKMTEILVESEVAEKRINANLANADNEKLKALSEARKKAQTMSNEELAAELDRRANQ